MGETDLIAALDEWPIHLRGQNRAEQTVKSYTDAVRRFLVWAEDKGRAPSLDPATLYAFTADLIAQGQESSTVRARQLGVRRFSAWMADEGLIEVDQLAHVKPVKIETKVIEPYSEAELKALLHEAKGTGFAERRDEAVLRLLIETGMRAGELVALKVADVDISRQVVVIRRTKTGEGRVVAFGSATAASLARYLRARRTHVKADTADLWLGSRQRRFTYYALHARLAGIAQRAGVPGFHPHRLRHTAAHRWLAAGGSDSGLMAVAGWSRPEMLVRYSKARAQARAQDEARTLNLGNL